MEAAGYGRLETVEFLLQAGARVDGAEKKSKQTALMTAAFGQKRRNEMPVRIPGPMADFVKIVALLLGNGAKVGDTDREGKTALHHAAAGGNTEAVKLLIEGGGGGRPKRHTVWTHPSAQRGLQWQCRDCSGSPGARSEHFGCR